MRGFYVFASVLLSGAVLTAPVAAEEGRTILIAHLTGSGETGGGSPTGKAEFRAEVEDGAFCYTLIQTGLKPTMAHIHSGAAGADGAVVLPLEITTPTDGDRCAALTGDQLTAILAAPENFYVNIHTAEFPKGAVRGQLAKQ